MSFSSKIEIDLSKMSLEELRLLVSKAEHILELRRFEKGLTKAVREFKARDPSIIRS